MGQGATRDAIRNAPKTEYYNGTTGKTYYAASQRQNKEYTGEVFTLDDAKQLSKFAEANHWVAFLSFWSVHRDRGVGGGLESSSQIAQKPWEFSSLL